MKNFIASLSLLWMIAFTCHAQIDPRVAKLEQLYWDQGAFVEAYTLTESLLGYMEIVENPLNECVINIYKGLVETHLSLTTDETINSLQDVQNLLSETEDAPVKYVGLALLAQSKYYTSINPALSVELGDKALDVLQKECPNTIELALAKAVVGYSYFFHGNGAKSEQLLTSSIELLKACNRYDSWMASMFHAYRGAAYIALRNGDSAIHEITNSFAFLEGKEPDRILFQHMLLSFGLAVYIHTSCGLYDNAIAMGESLLQACVDLEMQNILEYGNTLQNIGAAYFLKKDQEQGLAYYSKAKTFYEEHGYTDTESYRMLVRHLEQLNQ